jgi:hypothetical protein
MLVQGDSGQFSGVKRKNSIPPHPVLQRWRKLTSVLAISYAVVICLDYLLASTRVQSGIVIAKHFQPKRTDRSLIFTEKGNHLFEWTRRKRSAKCHLIIKPAEGGKVTVSCDRETFRKITVGQSVSYSIRQGALTKMNYEEYYGLNSADN